ncbi:gpi anchored serine-threonine rich protein [Colletotrichum incanum]|uniref:Gpi anchored serine-threonine rich protein n=1 Tax=Colletotrichum incanum TaxID=1573173 RepID=A0A161WFQ9_COLIC|nr:gpi anchored serine-threonine rich protein [Colletotrichum incanum]OHW92364.1 GPI anchored serine-threonine rich protein [Colletotrichum incanum]
MQFKISAAALLAFAASALAQNPNFNPVYKPTSNEKVNAGTTLSIEWDAPEAFKDVTVSISLIGGATQNSQVPLLDIVSGIPNSAEKYSWTIPSTLGKDAFYGLVIKSDANPTVDFQYSNPFHIVAGEGSSSGTTTVVASSGTATVTLSANTASVTPTSSASASASASVSESVIINSTTALSTTAAPTAVTPSQSAAATTITSVTRPASNGTATRTASTTIATVPAAGAGAQATAGVFAVLGGIAVAALL